MLQLQVVWSHPLQPCRFYYTFFPSITILSTPEYANYENSYGGKPSLLDTAISWSYYPKNWRNLNWLHHKKKSFIKEIQIRTIWKKGEVLEGFGIMVFSDGSKMNYGLECRLDQSGIQSPRTQDSVFQIELLTITEICWLGKPHATPQRNTTSDYKNVWIHHFIVGVSIMISHWTEQFKRFIQCQIIFVHSSQNRVGNEPAVQIRLLSNTTRT